MTDSLVLIPNICEQYGIDCYPGAWISKYPCENEKQISNLLHITTQNLIHVKGLIVGNEVLLRNDISETELIEYIKRVKKSTKLPVASAETWKGWLDHPSYANAVDVMFVHIYPYWDGQPIENASNYILSKWNELKAKYPGKKMVIGETGWPSVGETHGQAVPSETNQKRYLSDFIQLAEANNIDYFYFEIFDEKWKIRLEGTSGIHWGIYNADGSLKNYLTEHVPYSAQKTILRPSRKVFSTPATLPLSVYSDGCNPDNKFYSSGWMEELSTFGKDSNSFNPTRIIDESCILFPYRGNSCIRVAYKPAVNQCGGIYWQYPVNNWGQYPGYNLSNAIKPDDPIELSFWARGKNGNEKVEFKIGGVNNPDLAYHDSFGPVSTGVVMLTTEWKQYRINLTGQNFSMLIGGFCWFTDSFLNQNGVTFYLDDIVIRKVD